MASRMYFITGVCGVGKSSIIPRLKSCLPSECFDVHDFDERGVPSGADRKWRMSETRYWIDRSIVNGKDGIATIVCGFANPEESVLVDENSDFRIEYILLDADEGVIKRRLSGRYADSENQENIQRVTGDSVEVFIQNNVSFSSVLRDICKKKGCAIVDTSHLSIAQVADEVVKFIL